MSWRIVEITKRAKLDLKMNYMVVRAEETIQIHLSEIYMLIIESTAVSLTAALLVELNKRKIKVVFCDEARNPSFEMVSYYGGHNTSLKVKLQTAWSSEAKGTVWTEIVREKIRQQGCLLAAHAKDEHCLLAEYYADVIYNDATNREGHAAKVYFNALFGKDFTRSSETVVNAALNYGYGILLSAFNREVVANGYITQIGLFHDNRFNAFNLSCDLMEPFRPLVDNCVLSMKIERFERVEKLSLVGLLNKEVVIYNQKQYLNNAIRIYCKSVFEAIEHQDIACIRFYQNEF